MWLVFSYETSTLKRKASVIKCTGKYKLSVHTEQEYLRFWKWWLRTKPRGNVVWNGNRKDTNLLEFTCMYYFCHVTLKNMIEHEVVSYLILDIQIILDCNCALRFRYLFKSYYSIFYIKPRKHQLCKVYCNTAPMFLKLKIKFDKCKDETSLKMQHKLQTQRKWKKNIVP